MIKEAMLLHTCCAPCVTYVHELLIDNYILTAYFFNPNIHPLEEYERRREELKIFSGKVNLNLIIEDADTGEWFEYIKGLEAEPEGSLRCYKCFEMRLEQTAKFAANNDFYIFTTALSISPHKNATRINEIGLKLATKYKVKFLEANFKKNEGFKKSCEISKKFNLYRQNYCGCKFSSLKIEKNNY